MKKSCFLVFLTFLINFVPLMAEVQSKNQLENELKSIVQSFEGRAGIYVYHFEKKEETAVYADSVFPTASMIKVPIMAKIFDLIEKNELKFGQEMEYTGEPKYPYEPDLINIAKEGAKVPIYKLLFIMLSLSDNTASLWLQDIAGTGTAINHWLGKNGWEKTRVNSRTEGREKDRERYGWGQTTPREMARFFRLIYEGKLISAEASEKMYRMLSASFWSDKSLSEIPPTVQTISKQGFVSQAKSEVYLVNSKGGTYLVCAATDDQKMAGYEPDNPGYVFLQKVSKTVYQYYNKDEHYQTKVGVKFWLE